MKRLLPFVLLTVACGKPAEKKNEPAKGADAAAKEVRQPAAGDAAGGTTEPVKVEIPPAPPLPEDPRALPPLPESAENPMTPEKVALGKLLFFDKRLSKDGSASCESCHQHKLGWTDAKMVSVKVGGDHNKRHTPTLYNVGYQKLWYWDGRAPTLEKQILAAWKGQMGADPDATAAKLKDIPEYAARFDQVFGGAPTADQVTFALAAFVRTLRSGDSAWDRFEGGDKDAVSDAAKKGFEVFRARAQCALCHTPPLYTDLGFHNVGVGYGDNPNEPKDKGREDPTKDPADSGKFKTPTLRSITKSGPYFHDGSVASLDEAVKFMVSGGHANANLDANMKPRNISDEEMGQLLEFLKSLESTESFEPPTSLPE